MLGISLYMDEATATCSRVDFAHVSIVINSNFSFPRTTLLEVDGTLDDVEVDYDWRPMPCQRCSSFHEPSSCVTVYDTLAAMEETATHALATGSLETKEAVAAPGGTPTPPPSDTATPEP